MNKIRYIDSHTGGEPTRVVLDGFPYPQNIPLSERVEFLRAHHDKFRAATAAEPRASDAMVGALLMPPLNAGSVASVIFFNNAGYLGMCGHGTIGLIATLRYLGKISPGIHAIDTPAGTVACTLRADGVVSIENVASYRYRKGVAVNTASHGEVIGDVAWGGNWFFLVDGGDRPIDLANIDKLMSFARAIREALTAAKITGRRGEEIDHVEIFGAPSRPECHLRSGSGQATQSGRYRPGFLCSKPWPGTPACRHRSFLGQERRELHLFPILTRPARSTFNPA